MKVRMVIIARRLRYLREHHHQSMKVRMVTIAPNLVTDAHLLVAVEAERNNNKEVIYTSSEYKIRLIAILLGLYNPEEDMSFSPGEVEVEDEIWDMIKVIDKHVLKIRKLIEDKESTKVSKEELMAVIRTVLLLG